VFFTLHKHCNLTKWEIWDYTLPQIEDLIMKADKYIKFEIEVMQAPMKAMFGQGGESTVPTFTAGEEAASSDAYHDATEEDINMLARFLGGGM